MKGTEENRGMKKVVMKKVVMNGDRMESEEKNEIN